MQKLGGSYHGDMTITRVHYLRIRINLKHVKQVNNILNNEGVGEGVVKEIRGVVNFLLYDLASCEYCILSEHV